MGFSGFPNRTRWFRFCAIAMRKPGIRRPTVLGIERCRKCNGETGMRTMADEGKADAQLFQLLSTLLEQVESLSNQEEVELRAKIEALGLEVTKVPPKSSKNLDELEIAAELDRLSAKLDEVDQMISSTMAADPEVQSLLSSTADVWMPVITANADERRAFSVADAESNQEEQPVLPSH